MARDRVKSDERRKARFLTEYRRMCARHGMMIGMGIMPDGAEAYCVIDLRKRPEQLNAMVQDVMIESVYYPGD